MRLKAEVPAMQWIGSVDAHHSEKLIHKGKEKERDIKTRQNGLTFFFPCPLLSKLNNDMIICQSSFQQ